jgi:hypothetical protein
MDDALATALADTGTDGATSLRGSGAGGSGGLVARDGTGAGLAPRNDVWRGRRSVAPVPATATGFPVLDALLPGQGWPVGGLCEVLHPLDGLGELALVLPALARLARDPVRPVVWVAPPYWPFAPALRAHGLDLAHVRVIQTAPQQALWAAEQCLRAGCCAAVLVWPQRIDGTALRRLQLAAETGRCHAFVFRDARHAGDASPAPLRLAVRREQGQPVIRVIKCRGLLAPPAHELALATSPANTSATHARVALSSVPDTATAQRAVVAAMADTPVPSPTLSSEDAAARAATAHRYASATRLPSLHAVAEAALADSDSYRVDVGAAAGGKDPSP